MIKFFEKVREKVKDDVNVRDLRYGTLTSFLEVSIPRNPPSHNYMFPVRDLSFNQMKNLSEAHFRAKYQHVAWTAVDCSTYILIRVRNLFFPQLVTKHSRTRPVVCHLSDHHRNYYRHKKVQRTTSIMRNREAAAADDIVDLANEHADFAPSENNPMSPKKVRLKKVPSSNASGVQNNTRPLQ